MAQGDYIKALRILSRQKGWDPNELILGDEQPVDIQKRAGAWNAPGPMDDSPDRTVSSTTEDWNYGTGDKETNDHRGTTNADPYPGMGKM
jgi:hypothetical protein